MPQDPVAQQLQDEASDMGMQIIQIPHNWEPRLYQDDCWQYFQNGGLRGCTCWHRRAGKDLFGINLIAKKNIERPGLYWHAFPTQLQGRKTIWDGVTGDGRPFLDHFPGYQNPGADGSWVLSKREDLMQVKFRRTPCPITYEMRETGGIYQVVGLDDPDTLVGPNPFGIVFSEWSLCPERAWHLFKPMLNENGGWALFIFTMRGRNHAWKMMQKARTSPKWFCQLLTVDDTYKLVKTNEIDEESQTPIYVPRPVVTQEQIQEDRDDGMPEETIQSEYYGSADAPMPGSYYGAIVDQIEKEVTNEEGEIIKFSQITNVPHNPALPVHTFWDIGHDSTSIGFFQALAQEIHIINFYENSGEPFSHYARVLKEWGRELQYDYELYLGPHDLIQREYMKGKSKIDAAKEFGIKFTLVPKHSLEDGINETRALLKRCWIDKEKCGTSKNNKQNSFVDAIRSYRKEWDEKHQVFRETPVHDWASHPADALRQLAMGFRDRMIFRKKRDPNMTKAKVNYDELRY